MATGHGAGGEGMKIRRWKEEKPGLKSHLHQLLAEWNLSLSFFTG